MLLFRLTCVVFFILSLSAPQLALGKKLPTGKIYILEENPCIAWISIQNGSENIIGGFNCKELAKLKNGKGNFTIKDASFGGNSYMHDFPKLNAATEKRAAKNKNILLLRNSDKKHQKIISVHMRLDVIITIEGKHINILIDPADNEPINMGWEKRDEYEYLVPNPLYKNP